MDKSKLETTLKLDIIRPDEFFEICSHFFYKQNINHKFEKNNISFYKNQEKLLSITLNSPLRVTFIKPKKILEEDIENVAHEINLALTADKQKVYRKIIFSEIELTKSINCNGLFQLCPTPSSAPRHEQKLGKHPLIIEVLYDSTKSSIINTFRENKTLQKYIYLSNLLLNSKIYECKNSAKEWACTGLNPEQYSYCSLTYSIVGFEHNSEKLSNFEQTLQFDIQLNNSKNIDNQKFWEYYFKEDLFRPFQKPSNFDALIKKFESKDENFKKLFLNALYWFYQVNYQEFSTGISLSCLANAIHAASNANDFCHQCKQKIGDKRKFINFLDRYAIDDNYSKEFYKEYRCYLAHGGVLDSDITVGINIMHPSFNEGSKVYGFRYLTRSALINFLIHHE